MYIYKYIYIYKYLVIYIQYISTCISMDMHSRFMNFKVTIWHGVEMKDCSGYPTKIVDVSKTART